MRRFRSFVLDEARRQLLRDGDQLSFGRMQVTYRESAAGLATVTELSRVEAVAPAR
jgi:hypothetical protein